MKVNVTLDTEELRVPQGWEIDGVRVAKEGDYYLCEGKELRAQWGTSSPVVILRKLFNLNDYSCTVTAKEVYGKDFKVPDGYEVIDFRCPSAGDLVLLDGGMWTLRAAYKLDTPRFIVKKTGE